MSGTIFVVTLADGSIVGPCRIQGNGGEIGAAMSHLVGTSDEAHIGHESLRRAQCYARLATKGRPLPIYEPSPGHVRAFFGEERPCVSDENVVDIPIVGALFALA